MDYARTVTLTLPFDEAVTKVKEALQQQGFGTLTEIDVQATLREKLGVDVAPYRIIGACNPRLAHKALASVPEVGVLLPCNVVVRRQDDRTIVDAMDPAFMAKVVGAPAVDEVAGEAATLVQAAMDALAAG